MSFPIIKDRRFWPFRLNELFDLFSHTVLSFCNDLDEPKPLADKVIREIEYPFYMGRPDDSHLWNAYHRKYKRCYRQDVDFWQKGGETAYVKVGDCEDSSLLFVTGCGSPELKVSSTNVYEVFGVVRDAKTRQILGGHGWNYCKWNNKFHLVESTLDRPPEKYPVVKDIRKPYRLRNWIYDPYVLFNWDKFEEVEEDMLVKYMKMNFREKERRIKYEALMSAWRIPMKPLKKINWFSRFRWRK